MKKYSLFIAALVFVAPLTAQGQSGDEVIAQLKSAYESVDALRAQFTQTMSSSFMDQSQQTSGILTLQGDMYRVESGDQTIITDGVATWVYTESQAQLLINDYVEDETTFSINKFFFHFDERYAVDGMSSETVDGSAHYVLSLSPKATDSFFTHVTLWVRKSDTVITKLKLLDANETEMTFGLKSIEINPELLDNTFTFTPPDGTEVIDLRS